MYMGFLEHRLRFKSYQYIYVCKYVDQNWVAAMLASMRSAGDTQKVNRSMHADDKVHKRRIHPGFEL